MHNRYGKHDSPSTAGFYEEGPPAISAAELVFLIFKCSDHEIAEKIVTEHDLPKLQRKAIVEVVFADAGGGQAFIVVTMGSGFAVVRAMRTEADGPNTLVRAGDRDIRHRAALCRPQAWTAAFGGAALRGRAAYIPARPAGDHGDAPANRPRRGP
ncbi:hypothetical protein ATY31_05430 [Sinorhizobium americanum]|uniref:Uncharacterized protein n=1 Tax=Sinorhizobium americanum TaxID=194963 RepID=A0A2S3YT62_9HYPH|nr:hypothetical protein ATY31_05430 [Sinorhizobium americanum]